MLIAVLVKQVPDTGDVRELDPEKHVVDRAGGNPVLDEINERAVEFALRLKDRDKSVEVTLVSMGPQGVKNSLRKALAMGADSAVHIEDPALAGADAAVTARVLSRALKRIGADLVVAGKASTDGGMQVVPPMIAQLLDLPYLGSLDEVELNGSSLTGARTADGRVTRLGANLPAVITVTDRHPDARFPGLKGVIAAKRKPVTALDLAALGMDPSEAVSLTRVTSSKASPPRQPGPRILDDGTAADQLVSFLESRSLL